MKGNSAISENSGGDFPNRLPTTPICPNQNLRIRCYGVAHLGHKKNMFAGTPSKDGYKAPLYKNVFMLFFETIDERAVFYDDGKELPFGLNKEMNWVYAEKSSLAALCLSWFGQPYSPSWFNEFDSRNFLGRCGNGNVIHVAKPGKSPYARLDAITRFSKRDEADLGEPVNEPFYYSIFEHGVSSDVFLRLPKWVRDQMARDDYSEYQQLRQKGIIPWDFKNKPAPNLDALELTPNGTLKFIPPGIFFEKQQVSRSAPLDYSREAAAAEGVFPSANATPAPVSTGDAFGDFLPEEDDLPF